MKEFKEIIGSGGGGSPAPPPAPPPPYVPVESPNTLQSKATYRMVDLLCEGEIEGLVAGDKSIYIDDVVLQNDDDSYNFSGINTEVRNGLPTQDPVSGYHDGAATPIAVSSVVSSENPPLVRASTTVHINFIYLLFSASAMYYQKSNGDVTGTSVTLRYQIYETSNPTNTTGWISKTLTGKCMSNYQFQYKVDLPTGASGDYTIEVDRVTADPTDTKTRNEITWLSYTEVIDHKFEYPDTAYIASTVDSSIFGNKVPKRSFRIKGLKVATPKGYTPPYKDTDGVWQAAVYPGDAGNPITSWDGTLVTDPTYNTGGVQYTSNAAWCYYDMIVNSRYGAGVDDPGGMLKYSLYPIAQYCDELVPDGYGGYEPRFQINCVINTQQEAYTLINLLSSVFRGMSWWGPGAILASQDAPTNPVTGESDAQVLVTPSNVIDGIFKYEGSSLKERHTVVLVTWNNPEDHFRPVIEYVEADIDDLITYGHKVLEIAPFGCTSRGMANRAGKWVLDSEKNETEVVTYAAGLDHTFVNPGNIIAIADPFYSNAVRFGGRVISVTGTDVVIDSGVTLELNTTYVLACTTPAASDDSNPAVEEKNITTTSDGNEHVNLTIDSVFTNDPDPGSVWIITAVGAEARSPRLFRVLSVTESENNSFVVSALFHDPTKYARVEQDITLDPVEYFQEGTTGAIQPPVNPTVTLEVYYLGGQLRNKLNLSWEEPSDERVRTYKAQYKLEDGNWSTPVVVNTPLVEFDNMTPVQHYFRIQSVSLSGATSEATTTDFDITPDEVLNVTDFALDSGTDQLLLNSDGTLVTQIKATWVASTSEYIDGYDLQYKKSVDVDWQSHIGVSVETFTISPAQDNVDYDVRVRAYNARGVRSEWSTISNYTVIGKTEPPADVTGFSIDRNKFDWSPVGDLDLAGYRVKFQPGINYSWADAAKIQQGLILSHPYESNVFPTGINTFMVKAVDTSGNESLNVTALTVDRGDFGSEWGDTVVANVIETLDEHALGYPGTKVDCTVISGDLMADDGSNLMWNPVDTNMWKASSDPMFVSQVWAALEYYTSYEPSLSQVGSNMTIDYTMTGETYSVLYRRNGPGLMWSTGTDDLMWNVDSAEMWDIPDYQAWPGIVTALNEPFDFKFIGGFGAIRSSITKLTIQVDVPDVTENLDNIAIGSSGTVLPIVKSYNVIKNVHLTIQDDGGTAAVVRVIDKIATGPTVKVFNSSDAATTGVVDATIQGY